MITYRLVFFLLSPLILIHLCWKSIKTKSLRYFKQRLGYGIKPPYNDPIWFHCASVGEVHTVLPLIEALHRQNTDLHFLITSNTSTSAGIVRKQDKSYLQHAYLPLDWGSATRRFLNTVKPGSLYIVETELWPSLIDEAHRKQINIYIINGRLSHRTINTNNWMSSIYHQTLQKIDHIYARTETDQSRFIKMGADKNKTSTIGNLKYAIREQKIAGQELTKRDYVIAASTHEDEELQIARYWLELDRSELLVLAPRHPERKNRIIDQLSSLTDQVVSRTDNDEIKDDTKIFILDSVGELVTWFASAKAVIMGGSFVNSGGHNVIEPAQQGKAILYGPHMENFQFESTLLLDNKAALQVNSIKELATTLTIVLDEEAIRTQLEEDALETVRPFENILSTYTDIVIDNIK